MLKFTCMALIGRARLDRPGSIWGAPIPVLSNRKYLPIVDKKGALDRLGRSNRARPFSNNKSNCSRRPLHTLLKSIVLLCFIQLPSGLQDRVREYYIIHPQFIIFYGQYLFLFITSKGVVNMLHLFCLKIFSHFRDMKFVYPIIEFHSSLLTMCQLFISKCTLLIGLRFELLQSQN